MGSILTDEQLNSIASDHQPDYDSIGRCCCAETYPCTTLSLIMDLKMLRNGIKAHREEVRKEQICCEHCIEVGKEAFIPWHHAKLYSLLGEED